MAIQRTNGYTFSCHDCGYFGPLRTRRGTALQDELDHHRQVPGGGCGCPVLNDAQHHATGCDAWHRHLVEEAREQSWPGATT